MEEWKDVVGYEGLYKISNKGRVLSLERYVRHSKNFLRIHNQRIVKPRTDGGGYLMVGLYKEGVSRHFKIHRLVMIAFVGLDDERKEVNHLDENKKNNNLNNLAWVTKLENENWGTKRARCVQNTNYKLIGEKTSKAVRQLDINRKHVMTWKSLSEIHNKLGYSKGNISMACNGKYIKPLYGCYWEFS